MSHLTILKVARLTEPPARPTSLYLPGFRGLARSRPENRTSSAPRRPGG